MRNSHSVLFDTHESIAHLTINRPEAMNALDPGVLSCLARQLDHVKADPRIAAVIVTGAGGKAFSSGADIKYLNAATPSAIHDFSRQAGALANRIETLGKIVVAAINGHAYGNGLELALSCALRIAGSVGISRLARLVGRGRATELLLRGRILLAEEACQIGLINAVVDDDRLIAEAEAMIRDLLALSPAALRYTWEACCRGFDLPPAESAELGADLLGRCATTEDFRIGTQAFVDKTKPVFVGH